MTTAVITMFPAVGLLVAAVAQVALAMLAAALFRSMAAVILHTVLIIQLVAMELEQAQTLHILAAPAVLALTPSVMVAVTLLPAIVVLLAQ